MNTAYFEQSRHIVSERETSMSGIGTLGEKTVHSTLKQYLSGNIRNQEIKIGSFFADACVDGHIFEIQTRQF